MAFSEDSRGHAQIEKLDGFVSTVEDGSSLDDGAYQPGHTEADRTDMHRLGKKQEFKRNYGFWATLGFASIYLATWEYLLVGVYSGLVNGGFGGLVYEYIGTTICYFTVVLSLAEMASMAPTSGGQYHWVSEFAPPRFQRYLSYAAGWTSCMAWLTGAASGYYILSTLFGAVVEAWLPHWGFSNWQATLVMMACVLITVFFNTFAARLLPMIETISLVGHIVGWIVTIVILWVMAPKNSAHDVFVEVVNSGGWSNTGLSALVGTVAILYCQLGPDAAVHIAEEIQDASVVLPRVMVWGYLYNAILGFVMLITMLFTVGDLKAAINASSPFQNSFRNTGSTGVNAFLTIFLLILVLSGNVTAIATSSRETWAFARDGGFPFHKWIARVSQRYNAPLNAVALTTLLAFLLCLINLGSTIAFNIVISLNLVAFLATYLLSIGCILWKRLTHQPLPPARWSLGRWGIPINAFACAYSVLATIFSCFPVQIPTDLADANWAPAIFAGVLLIALVSFLLQGRKIYEGPVVFVEGVRKRDDYLQTT